MVDVGSHTSALDDPWSRLTIPGTVPPDHAVVDRCECAAPQDRALVDRCACSATPDHRPSRRTLPSSIAVSRAAGPLSLASERIGAHTDPVASLTRRAPTRGPVDPVVLPRRAAGPTPSSIVAASRCRAKVRAVADCSPADDWKVNQRDVAASLQPSGAAPRRASIRPNTRRYGDRRRVRTPSQGPRRRRP